MGMRFDLRNSTIVKGVATCLLLWHHLFYNANFSVSFSTHYLPGIISYYSKVCVALFVILSGYGLTESLKTKECSAKQFYIKHFKKLYLNYWLMWILFVPIGVLFFGRTFSSVYGDHKELHLLLNILGLQKLFNFQSYNATWWFMSLILGLYLGFPLMHSLAKRFPNTMLLASFLVLFAPHFNIPRNGLVKVYYPWIFPFMLGIYFSMKDLFTTIASSKTFTKYSKLIIYTALIYITMILRRRGIEILNYRISGELIDGFLGLFIVLLCFEFISRVKYLDEVLFFIGTHSFNIFLFHSFIYYYYFKAFIYSFQSPVLIFFVLLFTCLIVSIGIEKIKGFAYNTVKYKQHEGKELNINRIN